MDLSGDGRRIAGWGGAGVVVLDAASGRELHRFATASPEGLVLSHDGRRLAAWFPGGTVRMWSVDAGRELGVLRDVEQRILEFDRVGRLRLLADGGALDLWDPIVGTRRRIGEGVWMPMGESPDARYFAYSALGTGLHVVDTATGARTLHVPEMVGAFDAAGHFVTAQDGGELTIWSVTDWSRVRGLRIQSVGSGGGGGGLMAVSPDGALVASSSGIWSTTDGRQLASLGHEVAKTGMPGNQIEFKLDQPRFTADGAALIVENERGTRNWDVRPELRVPDAIAQVLAERQRWRVVDGQLVQDDAHREVVRSAAITGRVTRHGAGVAGVKVLVEIERDRRVPLATTGSDGRFEIVGLAPRAYAVGAATSDAFADPVSIVASDHPRAVDLELAWEGSIAGIVRDEDGVPLRDVVVRVQDPENTDVGAGVSNERGEFVIGALRGGRAYEVTLNDPARTILRAPSGPTRLVVETARTKVTGVEVVVARQARARPGIDPAFYYRLGTRWQGAGRSLDVINDGANDQLEFRTDAPYTGQHWRLEPAGDGLFRLSTAWEGAGKTLAIADDGASVHLVAGGGERWKLTPVGTGGYRLTSQSQGEARSLAGDCRSWTPQPTVTGGPRAPALASTPSRTVRG